MNEPSTANRRSRDRGFSLIELMIAIAIGLVIVAAIGYMFQTSKLSYNTGQGMARLQENARTAQIIFGSVIRQAGYIDDPITNNDPSLIFTSSYPAVSGGDPATLKTSFSWASNPSAASSTGFNASVDEDKLPLNNDFLEIAFSGDAAGNDMYDCQGTAVPTDEISVNVFYVDQTGSDPVPSLYCIAALFKFKGTAPLNNPVAQPIISGISGLQVKYGIDPADKGYPQYYVTRSAYKGAGGVSGTDWTNWNQVKSLTIRLTAQSNDQALAAPLSSAASVTLATTNTQTVRQGYLTRPIISTFFMRNRLVRPTS